MRQITIDEAMDFWVRDGDIKFKSDDGRFSIAGDWEVVPNHLRYHDTVFLEKEEVKIVPNHNKKGVA